MKLKPAGFRVIVEVEPVEDTHAGTSIVMVHDEAVREHGGRDIGVVVSFGPLVYLGYKGCKTPDDWCPGLKVGSKVEFNRYDGKTSRAAELDKSLINYRIINDNDIICVLEK